MFVCYMFSMLFKCVFLRPGSIVRCICCFSLPQNPGQKKTLTKNPVKKLVKHLGGLIGRKLFENHFKTFQKTSPKLLPTQNRKLQISGSGSPLGSRRCSLYSTTDRDRRCRAGGTLGGFVASEEVCPHRWQEPSTPP